ncbi:hypothetical protein BG000_004254 [Podila horticola]|nr:hypothetical protein BG000_004254 [Podila horticola]
MASYQPIDDSQSWSSHDVLFGGSTDQERMIEQGAGVTVLVLVSLTLLFSIINTHKSGAHLMLGFIITGFALCLGHLILAQTVLLTLLCIIANIYFWQ